MRPKRNFSKKVRYHWLKNDMLQRIFLPWLPIDPPAVRQDSPSQLKQRTYHLSPKHLLSSKKPNACFVKTKSPCSIRGIRRGPWQGSFLERLEKKLNYEIAFSLSYGKTDIALKHVKRFLSFSFHEERLREDRLAYLHAYLGEDDKAKRIFENRIERFKAEGNAQEIKSCLHYLTWLFPNNAGYKDRLILHLIQTGAERTALNELQEQKRQYRKEGLYHAADKALWKATAIAIRLKKVGALEPINPPGEITFSFDESDLGLDLEEINI